MVAYRYRVTGEDLYRALSPETRAEFGEHWRSQPTREGVVSFKFADDVEPPPHCHEGCGFAAESLCDFPVAEGKTCDVAVCEDHAHAIGHDMHYCPAHHAMWLEWRESNGYAEIMAFPFDASISGSGDEE